MMQHVKIGTWLRIGYGILMALILTMGIISWVISSRISGQINLIYNHPLEVSRAVGSLESGVISVSRHMKDLFMHPTPEEADVIFRDINQHRARIQSNLDVLYNRYLGPRQDVDHIRELLDVYYTELDRTFQLIREGDMEGAIGRTKSASGVTGLQVEKIEEAIGVVRLFAKNKADALLSEALARNRDLNIFIIIIFFTSLVVSFGVIVLLIARINKPVSVLSATMNAFTKGDFSVRSSFVSRNELGHLASGFNDMADSLEKELILAEKRKILVDAMLTTEEFSGFCQQLLLSLTKQTEASLGAVYVLNEDHSSFNIVEGIGLRMETCRPVPAGSLEGDTGSALATGSITYITDIPYDTRFLFSSVIGDLLPRELVTIPVSNAETTIAFITLGTLHRFEPATRQLLESLKPLINARMSGILLFRKNQLFSQQLKNQNQELEEQKRELSTMSEELKEQNRELSAQKVQLKEANRLKNTFLANMSHELRTPLNSVIALSGVLTRRLSGTIPPEESSYLGVIERNGRHLLSLINDLLDLSRIESGREEIEVTEFRLSDLLNEIVDTVRPMAGNKGLALETEYGETLPVMLNDYRKCRHILQNIIGNAVKFTHNGSVTVHADRLGDLASIKVRDSGIGIGQADLESIFDEFHQADSGNAREYEGTGLGLAIARKYALMLGGRIEVESAKGKGSTFTILLPVHVDGVTRSGNLLSRSAEPEREISASGALETDHHKHTILLVDDSEPAIIQMKDLFLSQGYQVVVAANGKEAIELSLGIAPDAILLDLMMPGMDGFAVLRHLREHESTLRIPVIILTAKYIAKEELSFLKTNNIRQLIQKGDINKDQLLESVALAISSSVSRIVEADAGSEKEPEPKPERKPIPVTGNPRILVVEDNADNMLTIKALLDERFRVFEATNGKEGILMAIEHLPHLILMDIALPVMNGIDALHAIRRDKRSGHIPVLAVTASAMRGDRDAILAEGFDGYISKPIDEKYFRETISRFIK